MYGGKCAYTGKPLDDDWQIDHKTPRCHYIWHQPEDTRNKFGIKYSCNDAENLMPSLRIVNHYKRSLDIEQFRQYMKQFHKRLGRLPNKTRVSRTEKRKSYMTEVANAFGITQDNPFCGIFYFENISPLASE